MEHLRWHKRMILDICLNKKLSALSATSQRHTRITSAQCNWDLLRRPTCLHKRSKGNFATDGFDRISRRRHRFSECSLAVEIHTSPIKRPAPKFIPKASIQMPVPRCFEIRGAADYLLNRWATASDSRA